MPLIPQQSVVVIKDARPMKGESFEDAAVRKFHETLATYPDCRIVSLVCNKVNIITPVTLIAVVETV